MVLPGRRKDQLIKQERLWLWIASFDATLIAGVGWLLDLPILYLFALLSFPVWAWVGTRPKVQALLDRSSKRVRHRQKVTDQEDA